MDPVLLSLGLLMVATAMTLLSHEPRTWLVAVAQGIGVQAVVGALASVVRVLWLTGDSADWPVSKRVIEIVQGVPTSAVGWSGPEIFQAVTAKAGSAAIESPDSFLPIAMGQILLVGIVLGWRKMEEERLTDPVQLLVIGLLITNVVCGVV